GILFSVHVLNEFVFVARRQRRQWPEILEWLALLEVFCPLPVPLTLETHHLAVKIAQRFGYHIFDSLVIAAALEASCDTLYSEDLQEGQRMEGLITRNPFRDKT